MRDEWKSTKKTKCIRQRGITGRAKNETGIFLRAAREGRPGSGKRGDQQGVASGEEQSRGSFERGEVRGERAAHHAEALPPWLTR